MSAFKAAQVAIVKKSRFISAQVGKSMMVSFFYFINQEDALHLLLVIVPTKDENGAVEGTNLTNRVKNYQCSKV